MMRQTNLQSRPNFRARHTATETCLQTLKTTTLTARPQVILPFTLSAIRTNDANEGPQNAFSGNPPTQARPRSPLA